MLLLAFLICFSFCNSQQIIHLNSLKGYNFKNPINSKPPYSVYISANRDSDDILSQVYIKSESGSLQNLLYLKNSSKNSNSNLLAATEIQENSFLISKLTDYQLYSLTGFLYITNSSQADDKKFQVYDVNQQFAISTEANKDHTLVFLNSKSQNHSSTISSWLQSPSCLVSMYQGFPQEDQKENLVIFSNPAPFFTQPLFIPHVEKFEVNFEIFHFKTSGSMKFDISPEPFNFDGYKTTAYRTTGFYMKSQYDNTNRTATVSCLRDTSYNGTTGLLIGASRVRPYSTVRFDFDDGPHYILDLGIRGINIEKIPKSLEISTNGTEDGEVYVQYLIWQDQLIPSTLAPTTTMLPETTTKGCLGIFGGGILMIIVLFNFLVIF
ncbi:hypothetical protein B9Z55_017255 [Caenorhabditis nigoni]|uniref:CUB-like domain-containing protein n=1 Tax=Caenorhabditis nigoni TaxID=1611254 RepID=A0A2G5T8Q9_9PELO|nr:hypothetical protein B9Z55_017255 [Caenorhabditis nigoni]